MDTQTILIALLVTFSVGTIGIVLLEPLLNGAVRAEKRQAEIAASSPRRAASKKRKQGLEAGNELGELNKARPRLTLEQKFQQAGVNWTRQFFWVVSAGCGVGLGIGMLVLFKEPLLAIGGAFVGALGLPNFWLKRLAKKRQGDFLKELPNAIEAIVRGIRSGLPLNDCIRLIAAEAQEPLKGEFRYIVEAQQIGLSTADAVQKIYERIPLPEVNFFSIVLQIQSKSGGNLGEILHNLSKVIRDRKKMRDKIQAISMEAKASAGIVGSLPVVVAVLVWLSTPQYMEMLWTTQEGKLGLLACAALMTTGTLVMRKMINFDI